MIEINGLVKKYGDKQVFSDYNLHVNDGEFLYIVGKSGKGKSTLLNIIGGLEDYDEGSVLVDGHNMKAMHDKRLFFRDTVGFLFQNFALLENRNVYQNLKLVLRKDKNHEIRNVLRKVGLEGKEKTMVYKLSGGEQQRVALARLLLKKCRLVLADEPTGSLDAANAEYVMKLLHEMNQSGKTVLVVTHNEQLIGEGERIERI